MPVIYEIQNKRSEIINLANRYNVNRIKLFGSVAEEQEKPESDIDFLVDCKDECSLFDLISLKNELEEMFKRKIDIVTESSIHWSIKDKIIGEAREI